MTVSRTAGSTFIGCEDRYIYRNDQICPIDCVGWGRVSVLDKRKSCQVHGACAEG